MKANTNRAANVIVCNWRTASGIIDCMEDAKREYMKRPKEELVDELIKANQMLNSLDDSVLYYLANMGEAVRVNTRFSRAYFGVLQGVHFELTEVEILVELNEWDSGSGKKFREFKVIRLPKSNVSSFELIKEREEVIEETLSDDEQLARLGAQFSAD